MGLIGKIKGYLYFLRDLSCSSRSEWQVAIRKRQGQTLYQGNSEGFRILRNSLRYWYADPFLFCHKGKEYLFVEMFDRWKEKGVIGVSRIRRGKCGRFHVCLELPWHLSYPCVFEDEKGIHMVPESYQSGEVWMYRCVDFPYKWKKERRLLEGYAVDTTPWQGDQGLIWFTTIFDSPHARINNNLWRISEKDGSSECVIRDDFCARGAGHFITTASGETIRPSQNCAGIYGGHLQFNRVESLTEEDYREQPLLRVYAPDADCAEDVLRIRCDGNTGRCYNGIHTYNATAGYEVIDLKIRDAKSSVSFVKNFGKHIADKFGKRGSL